MLEDRHKLSRLWEELTVQNARLQPGQAIPFAFGPDSFKRHRHLAAEAGIPVQVVESDSLLFDIDLPEDYQLAFNSLG